MLRTYAAASFATYSPDRPAVTGLTRTLPRIKRLRNDFPRRDAAALKAAGWMVQEAPTGSGATARPESGCAPGAAAGPNDEHRKRLDETSFLPHKSMDTLDERRKTATCKEATYNVVYRNFFSGSRNFFS